MFSEAKVTEIYCMADDFLQGICYHSIYEGNFLQSYNYSFKMMEKCDKFSRIII